jgi:hypothetical protein
MPRRGQWPWAAAVAFLASVDSPFVNATHVLVIGGISGVSDTAVRRAGRSTSVAAPSVRAGKVPP